MESLRPRGFTFQLTDLARSTRYSASGFTLVELIVVLGIIGTLATIVLSGQSTFNKSLVLANTAYDVALTIRSTQTLGLTSRQTTNSVGSVVGNAPYGIHFDTGNNTSFKIFADTNTPASCGNPTCATGDHVYKPQGDQYADTDIQTYNIQNGIVISDLCVYTSTTQWCQTTGNLTQSLDLSFVRPYPEPYISKDGTYALSPFSYTQACIKLSSPYGASKAILITASGQISANLTSCP